MAFTEPAVGLIGLRNIKEKTIEYFFPVDAADVMKFNPGVYELAGDGTVEANRINLVSLQQEIAGSTNNVMVTGVESFVAATPEPVKEAVLASADPKEEAKAPAKATPAPEPAKK